jgi:hypothetical protein
MFLHQRTFKHCFRKKIKLSLVGLIDASCKAGLKYLNLVDYNNLSKTLIIFKFRKLS